MYVVVCGLGKGQEKVPILWVLKLPLFLFLLLPFDSNSLYLRTYVCVCMYIRTCVYSPKAPQYINLRNEAYAPLYIFTNRYLNQVMAMYTAATEENIYSKVLGGEVNSPPPLQRNEMNHEEKGS